jgi:hypothetical protein
LDGVWGIDGIDTLREILVGYRRRNREGEFSIKNVVAVPDPILSDTRDRDELLEGFGPAVETAGCVNRGCC